MNKKEHTVTPASAMRAMRLLVKSGQIRGEVLRYRHPRISAAFQKLSSEGKCLAHMQGPSWEYMRVYCATRRTAALARGEDVPPPPSPLFRFSEAGDDVDDDDEVDDEE